MAEVVESVRCGEFEDLQQIPVLLCKSCVIVGKLLNFFEPILYLKNGCSNMHVLFSWDIKIN